MSLPLRLVGAALACALLLAAAGAGWEIARFGMDAAAASSRLEAEVRRYVADRSDAVLVLAGRVAAEQPLIVAASTSDEALSKLFARVAILSAPSPSAPVTVTIYVSGGATAYRVLAWSDGPAGEVAPDRLNGPAAVFVARGTAGIRLVCIQPIEAAGRRVAVIAAETVLARVTPDDIAILPTSYGDVTVLPSYGGAGELHHQTNSFVIAAPGGATLLQAQIDPAVIARHRTVFRQRTIAATVLPFALALLLFVGPILQRRARTRAEGRWLGWSSLAGIVVGMAAIGLASLARVVSAPAGTSAVVLALGLVAMAGIVPGGVWWRRTGRLSPAARPVLFVLEQLAAGALLLATTMAIAAWLSNRMTVATLAAWQSALFPFAPVELLDVWSALLTVLAIGWTTASVVAFVAGRWRVSSGTRTGWIACGLWLVPAVIAIALRLGPAWLPPAPALVFAGACALFGVQATRLRRSYRRTTQAMRLLFVFLALLVPIVVVYPMVAFIAERTTREAIEQIYGPATAGQDERLRAELTETEAEIDRLTTLPDKVSKSVAQDPIDSQAAFSVWRQTRLSRTRVVSDVELYGPDRELISRFALNFPEYVGSTAAQPWSGTGCEWQVSGEVTRFGAADRAMLHATRGLCDASGQLVGAVVIHVSPNDYQALPFLSSANPYGDVLGVAAIAESHPPDLEVVVYGWSSRPLFSSGRVVWSLGADLVSRLYRDGSPFWTMLDADGRSFHVYLLQNRAGTYAVGYPSLTVFDHAARLAEVTAVVGALFVLMQIGAAFWPLTRRAEAPVRVLLHEIRTSFYRKLFLFFVLAAVGPVVLFALLFGAYMTSRFRADVEAQASGVVTVARRVYEQVAAADQRPNASLQLPTDDVMVWIRQVIDQDVNLFEGPELRATSQRDLFNSGLLPTRTPAIVYRKIALERLPWFVAEDRQYLVAATPVSGGALPRIVSVPLASRQREIEDESDELSRGVLVGSVLVVLFAAGLGASLASRVSDPVARLTQATRQIAAGRLDVRIVADTADELRRLVDDFNTMTATLVAQRAELARTNQLKAWNEMARQVAHEIKNPLTPVQLAAEHLQRIHDDRGRPLGEAFDQCVRTILGQVRLLRQIASEFANFAGEPVSRPERLRLAELVESVVEPYRLGLAGKVRVETAIPAELPPVRADRTLLLRALTNLVENAIQAMPTGGLLRITAILDPGRIVLTVVDTGVGMDDLARRRAFEPYFSTKTSGSGLGLANAKRNIEREGGTIALESATGRGTTVTITLPISPEAAGSRGAS